MFVVGILVVGLCDETRGRHVALVKSCSFTEIKVFIVAGTGQVRMGSLSEENWMEG